MTYAAIALADLPTLRRFAAAIDNLPKALSDTAAANVEAVRELARVLDELPQRIAETVEALPRLFQLVQ